MTLDRDMGDEPFAADKAVALQRAASAAVRQLADFGAQAGITSSSDASRFLARCATILVSAVAVLDGVSEDSIRAAVVASAQEHLALLDKIRELRKAR